MRAKNCRRRAVGGGEQPSLQSTAGQHGIIADTSRQSLLSMADNHQLKGASDLGDLVLSELGHPGREIRTFCNPRYQCAGVRYDGCEGTWKISF